MEADRDEGEAEHKAPVLLLRGDLDEDKLEQKGKEHPKCDEHLVECSQCP